MNNNELGNGGRGPEVTRRRVLTTAGGAGILALGVGTDPSVASHTPAANEFEQGTVEFVELKEEYPNAADHPSAINGVCRFKLPNYNIDRSGNKLLLTTGSLDSVEAGGPIAAADGILYNEGSLFPLTKTKYILPIETDYSHQNSRYVFIEGDQSEGARNPNSSGGDDASDNSNQGPRRDIRRDPARLARMRAKNGSIGLETGRFSREIPSGSQNRIEAGLVTAPSRSGGPVSLSQHVSVRNHGEVEIFGHEEYRIYSLKSASPRASRLVGALLGAAPEKVATVESADLVAVPNDLQLNPGRPRRQTHGN